VDNKLRIFVSQTKED